MKHTECEDCKLRNGDCGHHFKMNGKTNYDIPSLSSCDRYGNCEFFQQKEKPKGDLVSRKALKEAFLDNCLHNCYYCKLAKWDKIRKQVKKWLLLLLYSALVLVRSSA